MLIQTEQPPVRRYDLHDLARIEAFGRRPSGGRFAGRGRFPQGGLWPTPLTILGASVVAWYRSDLGITVTGSGVSEWKDQTANAFHLTQGTDANRPPYDATGGPNGRPKLDFTGDFLVNAAINRPAPGTQPTFFWIVNTVIDFNVNARTCGMGVNMMGMTQPSSGNVDHYNQTSADSVGHALGVFKRVESYFANGAGVDYNKAGTNLVSSINAGNSDPAAGLVISGFDGGAGPVASANTRWCEFFIANALPSAGQIAALNAYAVGLYGASVIA